MENARFELPSSKEHWMDFLVFMGAHHKRPLDEQILAFTQNPDAKALAEYDWWNDHRRWVKRGSKGIGLLREVNGSLRHYYVFDINDTGSRYPPPVLWELKPEHHAAVSGALNLTFRNEDEEPFIDIIYSLISTVEAIRPLSKIAKV